MIPYVIRKRIMQILIFIPVPKWFLRLLRFYVRTKSGENFGDMTINGELKFIKQQVPASEIIFDVGAHTGSWSEHALSVNPEAKIHCFEPLKKNFEGLVNQAYASKLVCNPLGVSDKIQKTKIFKHSMSIYEREEFDRNIDLEQNSESIEMTTLDQYCNSNNIQQIDLLKIDTEGHDLAVLNGGKNLFDKELIFRIQFEYGPFNIYSKTLLKDFFSFFEDRPYTIYLILPRGLKKIQAYDFELENFVYKNFVALHDSIQS